MTIKIDHQDYVLYIPYKDSTQFKHKITDLTEQDLRDLIRVAREALGEEDKPAPKFEVKYVYKNPGDGPTESSWFDPWRFRRGYEIAVAPPADLKDVRFRIV